MRINAQTERSSKSLSRVQAGTVALMIGLSAMSYFDRTIMSIAGPSIMKEFNISETGMGTVFSAFLVSYAVFMAPGGRLADRFGPRRVLTLAGLGTALFTGLTGFPSAVVEIFMGVLPALLIVRFLFGVCASPLYPACGRMTANWFPPATTARVQALIISGAPLGGAISPVVFAALMARFGWRLSFWLAAAATAALFLVWHWYVRDHPGERGLEAPRQVSASILPAHPEGQTFSWRLLLTNRNLLLLTAGYFCLNYFEYIFFYWIYYYFGEIRKMGAGESAVYVTVLMLTMAVMTPLGGWVSDRLIQRYGRKKGRRLVPVIGLSLSAVLLFLGAGDFGVLATVTLLSLALGCAAASEGPFWASAIEVSGTNAGVAGGIMNSGGNVGGILSPVVTPIVASRFGWEGGLYFGSLIVAFSVVAWFFIDPE